MSRILDNVRVLVAAGAIRISSHGYDELAEDAIMARDLIASIEAASVIEDYPDRRRRP